MSYTESINAFLGLNQRDRVSVGELSKMHNCSAKRYPLLSPRYARGLFDNFPLDADEDVPIIEGSVVNNALFFSIKYGNNAYIVCLKNTNTRTVAGRYWTDTDIGKEYVILDDYLPLRVDSLKYNDEEIETTASYYESDEGCMVWEADEGLDDDEEIEITGVFLDKVYGPITESATSQLVAMGTYIVEFPSGYYFDSNRFLKGLLAETGYIAYQAAITASKVQLCDRFGEAVDAVAQNNAPAVQDGKYWVCTSGVSDLLKRYSATYAKWVDMSASCFMIKCANAFATSLSEGESVFYTINNVEQSGTIVKKDTANKWIILEGDYPRHSANISVTVKRKLPKMDFVCECENRLWGCRYGSNSDGVQVNEIYASALGNFKSWFNYQGLSTDAYAASRGCPGKWTGCINYLGSPTFFKENYIESVYPSATGAHKISTLNINGTGCTSAKSLCIVDNVLYYQGTKGFYSYSGSLPSEIGYNFGESFYKETVGGDLPGYYYAACKDESNNRHLFVYDTNNKLWTEEDDIVVEAFARVNSELYGIGDKMFTVRGTVGDTESRVWWAITGDLGISYDLDNGVSEVAIRASVGVGESIKIMIAYDGSDDFQMIGKILPSKDHKYVTYPIVPARCDHYKLKFIGSGESAVWSVTCKEHIGGRTK